MAEVNSDMIDLGINEDDFVQVHQIPGVVFRVESVNYRIAPPVAHLHYAGGRNTIDWSLLARWEPLTLLSKLNEMEALAWVARSKKCRP